MVFGFFFALWCSQEIQELEDKYKQKDDDWQKQQEELEQQLEESQKQLLALEDEMTTLRETVKWISVYLRHVYSWNTHTFEPVIGGTASYLFYHHLGNFLLLSSKTNFANWSMMADVASQIYRRGIAKTWRRGEKNSTENYSSEGRAIAGRDLSCRGKSAIILCSLFYLNLHIFLTGKGL